MAKISLGIMMITVLILAGCVRNKSAETYMAHVIQVRTLIEKHKHNTDTAGHEILEYVTANQAEIEAALVELGQFDAKQATTHYNRLMTPVNEIKALLDSDPVSYPDSVKDQILAILEQNQQVVDESIAEIQKNSIFFLTKIFAPFSARMKLIKGLTENAPLKNFNLKKNPEFQQAAQILKFDNLL